FGSGNTAATAINNYGQVAGAVHGPSWLGALWTPVAANATTGTVFADARLGNQSINDFGTVIAPGPNLFMPSAAHSANGTFTLLPNFPSDGTLLKINNSGIVVGKTSTQTLLYPSAASASPVAGPILLPIPAGYFNMIPT